MITRPDPTPTPPELARAPECAALSVLDNTLYTVAFALIAANDRVAVVIEENDSRHLDPKETLAEAILKNIEGLQSALRRYRNVASHTRSFLEDDELF